MRYDYWDTKLLNVFVSNNILLCFNYTEGHTVMNNIPFRKL